MKTTLVLAGVALGVLGDGRGILSHPGLVRVARASEGGLNAPGDKAWTFYEDSIKEASGRGAVAKKANFGNPSPLRLARAVTAAAAAMY